jgi:hypothetical protein
VASVTSLVLRFRRSSGVERQQIKWVALALAFLVASFLLSTIASGIGLNADLVDTIVSGLAFIALPSPSRSPSCSTACTTSTSS